MDYLLNFANANFVKTVILAMLIAGIKAAKPYIVEAYNQAVVLVQSKIATSQYAEQYQVALNIWYQVEEDYRIGATVTAEFQSKAAYFDQLLLSKFPSLVQTDLDTLRQAISGQENS